MPPEIRVGVGFAHRMSFRVRGRPKGRTAIAYRAAVRDLYRRLKERGFDRSFVQEFILPEWWDDALADVEANRALAESYIAKQLGFSLRELQDRERELSMPPIVEARFKRYKNEVDARVLASALVAQQAAARVIGALGDDRPQLEYFGAIEVREEILRESPAVDLESLLDFCWGRGIPVVQLCRVPKAGKGFDGMAAFVDHHPVIVLASNRDGPPWLAFHLAHELGHIMLKHVGPDESLLDPSVFRRADEGRYEREADAFACEVLTGHPEPRIDDRKLSAPRLATFAERQSTRLGVDAGVLALIYAKSNDRWAPAQAALKYLDLEAGGRAAVASRLKRWFPDLEELSEEDERLLRVLSSA
jgi:Zn-dependent peptidase ImmA (M78 family)